MGQVSSKTHPVALRACATRLVEQGSTQTEAARRLCFSTKFVNDLVRLRRKTGSLAPKWQGNPGRCMLTGVKGWLARRIAARPDLTIDELTVDLAADLAAEPHYACVLAHAKTAEVRMVHLAGVVLKPGARHADRLGPRPAGELSFAVPVAIALRRAVASPVTKPASKRASASSNTASMVAWTLARSVRLRRGPSGWFLDVVLDPAL